jgi:hypothetical protein
VVIAFPGTGEGATWDTLSGTETTGWNTFDRERNEYRLVSASADPEAFMFFNEAGESLLGHPRVYRHLCCGFDPDDGVETLIPLDDGNPFLLRRRVGLGQLYCFTVPLDSEACDLVVRAAFSPFLYELLNHGVSQATERSEYLVGDLLSVREAPGEGAVQLFTPDEKRLDAAEPIVLSQAGLYRLSRTGQLHHLVARIAEQESDLALMDETRIAQLERTSDSPGDAEGSMMFASSLITVRPPDAEGRFWWYLLAAVLALMAMETLLAARTAR